MKIEEIRNITDIITYQSIIRPDDIAVKYSNKTISYLELENLVCSVSHFLYDEKIQQNDVVAIESEDEFFILVLMLSIGRLGATVLCIPRNTPIILREDIIEKTNVKHIFNEESFDLDEIKDEYEDINKNIFCSSPTSPFILLIGSGSTGKKKIIPINHSAEISRVSNSFQWLIASPEDNIATCVHINFHISKAIYLATFFIGGTAVLFNKNSINLQDIYSKYNLTILHATVFHIGILLKNIPNSGSYNLPLLKRLYVGGSTVNDFLRREIIKKITSNLTVRYGINEVGTISKVEYEKSTRSSSVGKCLESVLVEIVDLNNNILPVNEVGEIRIKSKGIIEGYLDDEKSTNDSFKNGWFYPKDLGKFTSDHELIHMGRSDQMMIMNGINIYPIEIEQVMITHKDVEDVSVMPIKSTIHQDIPICAIVLKEGHFTNENELEKYSFDRLGSSAPSKIVILDVIPKNQQGKIVRDELKKKVEDKLFNKAEKVDSNISAQKLINAARSMDIPVLPFLEKTQYWQFGWGKNSIVFDVSSPFEDSYHGVKISMDKVQSKKLLKNLGMPIANHKIIKSNSELKLASKVIGFPCVVKPIRGAGGVGITSNINSFEDLKFAYKNARDTKFGQHPIMIEEFIKGDDYRIIVSHGKFLAAIRRCATHILGDGKSSIQELVTKINNRRRDSKSFLNEIKLDQKLISHIKRFDLSLNTVLEKNKEIPLSSTANLSSGGEGEDVSSTIHPQLKKMAELLSKVTGIVVLGIDYITTDISKPFDKTNGMITEFNHYISLSSADIYSDSAHFFKNILGSVPSRIPIVMVVIKEENFQFVTKYLEKNFKEEGFGWVCDNRIVIDDTNLKSSNKTLSSNISILLRQKTLSKALIICCEKEIINKDLPIDKVDSINVYNIKMSSKIKNSIKFSTIDFIEFTSIEELLSRSLEQLFYFSSSLLNDNKKIKKLLENQKIFTFKLKIDSLPLNLKLIDSWFEKVLKIDTSNKFESKILVNQVSYRILYLATVLFQAVNIPIFNDGKIENISYDSKIKEFIIDVNLNIIDYIPNNIFQMILDQSSKIIISYLNKSITMRNKKLLFGYINTYILRPYKTISGSGKSTIPILREAHKLNIPFMHFGSGIYQLGWGSKSKRMDRSTTQFDSAIGAKMAQSKIITSDLLRDMGLPAPENELVETKKDALKVAITLGFPVVVKPSDQDRGEGITIGIKNKEDLFNAFDVAKKSSRTKKIIVEKEVPGVCHRLFIVKGKLLYAVKRLPKSIFTDGKSSIKELINNANKREQNLPPWLKSEPFPTDKLAIDSIQKTGFSLLDIPKSGEIIPLREIESTKWGGIDEDVTNTIHQENIDIAISSVNFFGLYVAGIDIISEDITKPWYENGAIINEVNFSPLYGGGEISRETIPKFLNEFISDNGYIPITFLSDKISFEDAKKIQKEKQSSGINCFLITKDDNLKSKIKSIVLNPSVDELLIVNLHN